MYNDMVGSIQKEKSEIKKQSLRRLDLKTACSRAYEERTDKVGLDLF